LKKQAIITAGGHGLRMGSDLPKQFLPLAGRPILMHTIHDGVRPLITSGFIGRMYEEAASYGTAIPVLRLHESLRMVTGESSAPVDRDAYRTVQTPQVFLTEKLIMAYNQPYHSTFSDDASVYETLFSDIHLSEGEPYNIKITKPNDLKIAETLWIER